MSDLDRIRRAFAEHLKVLPQSTSWWHTSDGRRITAPEMLAMLERGDPDAEAFLDDVVSTALTLLRVRAKRTTVEEELRGALHEACDALAEDAQIYELGPARGYRMQRIDRLRKIAGPRK